MPAPAPADKNGLKAWLKQQLKATGRILDTLAEKAAAALPDIIGSIISWVLRTRAKRLDG